MLYPLSYEGGARQAVPGRGAAATAIVAGAPNPEPIPQRSRRRARRAPPRPPRPRKPGTRHTQAAPNHSKRRSLGAGTRANRAAPVSLTR